MRRRHDRLIGARKAACRGFITELIERCAREDEEALGRLVELLQPLVLAIVSREYPDRRADDVAVEVFVRVWQLAPSYDRRQVGPVTWIMRQIAELPEPAARSFVEEVA